MLSSRQQDEATTTSAPAAYSKALESSSKGLFLKSLVLASALLFTIATIIVAFVGGGLVLHNTMLAPPSRLVEGVHYVLYGTLEDLIDNVKYYLTHEDERLKIAQNGWK